MPNKGKKKCSVCSDYVNIRGFANHMKKHEREKTKEVEALFRTNPPIKEEQGFELSGLNTSPDRIQFLEKRVEEYRKALNNQTRFYRRLLGNILDATIQTAQEMRDDSID